MSGPSIQQQLLEEEIRRTGGNLSKVARRLGLNFHELKARYPLASPFLIPPRPKAELDRSTVRFSEHIVAVKWAYAVWSPSDSEAIGKARADYDAGTHEMCQGRVGDWVILYSIPRRERVQRKPYFVWEEITDE